MAGLALLLADHRIEMVYLLSKITDHYLVFSRSIRASSVQRIRMITRIYGGGPPGDHS